MSRTTLSVNADGLRVAGITAELDVSGGPLIVALHGGSYTSTYFDLPGHSLLTRAVSNEIRVIALDRPCYGRSDALSAVKVTFEHSAEARRRDHPAVGSHWTARSAPPVLLAPRPRQRSNPQTSRTASAVIQVAPTPESRRRLRSRRDPAIRDQSRRGGRRHLPG